MFYVNLGRETCWKHLYPGWGRSYLTREMWHELVMFMNDILISAATVI